MNADTEVAYLVRLGMNQVRRIGLAHPGGQGDAFADEQLANWTRMAMLEKLDIARSKSRGGWWDDSQYSIEHLRKLLLENIENGDMIDVVNFAAMIYVRECSDNP